MRGAAVVAVLLVLKTVAMAESQEEGTEYTNTWVVEIKGGEEEAQRVAKDLGFTYSGKVGKTLYTAYQTQSKMVKPN